MAEITNFAYQSEIMLDKSYKTFFDKLCDANGLNEMATLANAFFS